jgi:hypothetical protein
MSWNALTAVFRSETARCCCATRSSVVRSQPFPRFRYRPIWRVWLHVTLPYRSNKATLPPFRYSRTEEFLSPQRSIQDLTLGSLQLHNSNIGDAVHAR